MAKVTTQSIPSEERTDYKRACQISTSHKNIAYVKHRYPWRVPPLQAGGSRETNAQRTQRARFNYVKVKHALLSAADKVRWKDANPEYHSYLFGYNFFMLEGLMGGGPVQYPQMIKSIQVLKASVPTTGGHTFTLNPEIDGAKGVVLMQGSARKVPRVLRGDGSVAVAGSTLALGGTVDPVKCTVKLFGAGRFHVLDEATVPVFAYVDALTTTQITIKWSLEPKEAATISWEVTEHVEGAVYPVLVSISNTEVAVDWAEVPDAAADASITVVEYL